MDINITAASFDDPGKGTYITIMTDGVKSGLKARGFHVVVISAVDGNILKKNIFDTYLSGTASSNMVDFIESSPTGSVIVIAVRIEGTRYLKQSARNYIASLGSRHVATLGYRDTLAIVTAKGVPKPSWFAEKTAKSGNGPTRLACRLWLP